MYDHNPGKPLSLLCVCMCACECACACVYENAAAVVSVSLQKNLEQIRKGHSMDGARSHTLQEVCF